MIVSARSCSVRGAPYSPAFMGSCLTISQTCLPYVPSGQFRRFPYVTQAVVSSAPDLRVGLCNLVCVRGIWVIRLMVVGFVIGCGCNSGHWMPGMGVGMRRKLFCTSSGRWWSNLFRKLKLVCECWKWGSVLKLKTQPWWVTVPGL